MRNTKTLLISVAAAALIAGGGYSLAQAPTGQAMPETKAAPESAKPMEPKADTKVKADTKADTKVKADTKADTKVKADTKADTKAKASESKTMKSDTKADSTTKASDTKADSKSTTTTTGQGAAGTSAALSTEQRTRISTVIRQQNVQRVTNVNFSISVGTRVPRTVTRHRLPATVIEVYPSWRGYEYILVGDEIIVINPRTLEIVAVISV
jgi:outer membrane biosynthesis protein TonB